MNSKTKGDLSVIKVIGRFMEKGYSVSIPFGDCQKYDLIVDFNTSLKKVQVKTGRIRKGSLLFSVLSTITRAKGKIVTANYVGLVDYFAVFAPENGKVYLIPSSYTDLFKTGVNLRIDPPKNNQKKKINLAVDFEY